MCCACVCAMKIKPHPKLVVHFSEFCDKSLYAHCPYVDSWSRICDVNNEVTLPRVICWMCASRHFQRIIFMNYYYCSTTLHRLCQFGEVLSIVCHKNGLLENMIFFFVLFVFDFTIIMIIWHALDMPRARENDQIELQLQKKNRFQK